jgi:hypothetical protein
MMRGEFIRADGLIIPNNVSLAGAEVFLRAAFQGVAPTFFVGLVAGAPTLDMTMTNMAEPTIGVNGYQRIQLTRDDDGWPIVATSATECYVESEFALWEAAPGPFDKPVQRLALVGSGVYAVGAPVYALSGLMPAEIIIAPTTDESLRKFKYRLYI